MLLMACGPDAKVQDNTQNANSSNRNQDRAEQNTDFIPTTNPQSYRICQPAIEGNAQSSMQAYLNTILPWPPEGPPTACMKIYGNNLSNFEAAFRAEVAHDLGIHSHEMTPDEVVYSKIEGNSFRVIFLDGFGYVDIQAQRQSDGRHLASIRGANLPSFEDSFDAALRDLEEKCKNGTYSFLQCNGYYDPFNDPEFFRIGNNNYDFWFGAAENTILDQAERALRGEGGAQTYFLGRIRFYFNEIIQY